MRQKVERYCAFVMILHFYTTSSCRGYGITFYLLTEYDIGFKSSISLCGRNYNIEGIHNPGYSHFAELSEGSIDPNNKTPG